MALISQNFYRPKLLLIEPYTFSPCQDGQFWEDNWIRHRILCPSGTAYCVLIHLTPPLYQVPNCVLLASLGDGLGGTNNFTMARVHTLS